MDGQWVKFIAILDVDVECSIEAVLFEGELIELGLDILEDLEGYESEPCGVCLVVVLFQVDRQVEEFAHFETKSLLVDSEEDGFHFPEDFMHDSAIGIVFIADDFADDLIIIDHASVIELVNDVDLEISRALETEMFGDGLDDFCCPSFFSDAYVDSLSISERYSDGIIRLDTDSHLGLDDCGDMHDLLIHGEFPGSPDLSCRDAHHLLIDTVLRERFSEITTYLYV